MLKDSVYICTGEYFKGKPDIHGGVHSFKLDGTELQTPNAENSPRKEDIMKRILLNGSVSARRDTPVQRTPFDCGAFVCKFAECCRVKLDEFFAKRDAVIRSDGRTEN
uniref:Ubiquitin-like protease family profile domain-containing protein n=1 Tax=Ditylenchus dipsaci TaxID=166011 RepID=A0A915D2N6_9BILA